MAIKRIEAIYKFLQAARNLVKNKDMSKESILRFAKQEFGEVSQFLRKQIDDIFKAKPKTEKKGDVVPIKKDEGIMSQYKSIDDEVTQAEKDAIFDNFLANADRTYANFVTKALRDIQNASKSEQQQMIKAIKDRTGMFRYLDDADAEKILKSVGVTKEGIVAADAAKEIVKKRTKDIATGDVTGETSDLMKGLEDKMTGIKKPADEMKDIANKPIKNPRRPGGPLDPKIGIVRTAVREILHNNLKAGKINIPDAAEKEAIERYMANKDPIDIFRKTYGEDALEAIDSVADNLLEIDQAGGSYAGINKFLQDNKLFDFVPKKTYGYDESIVSADKILKQAEQDAKNKKILEDFDIDPDREPNADGGIIGNLRLNRTGYKIGGGIKLYKAGQGKFTKAQILIQRLENTIKEYKGKTDELATYVLETFPNFIKELKANPKLANNENVWKQLGQDLPSDQELVVYGDDTVDFFRQTEGPGNIERVTKFLEKNPFLNREEAIKIMKMEPTDQVMEVERLKTIRTKKHALGGRVQMAHGGLINILRL